MKLLILIIAIAIIGLWALNKTKKNKENEIEIFPFYAKKSVLTKVEQILIDLY